MHHGFVGVVLGITEGSSEQLAGSADGAREVYNPPAGPQPDNPCCGGLYKPSSPAGIIRVTLEVPCSRVSYLLVHREPWLIMTPNGETLSTTHNMSTAAMLPI